MSSTQNQRILELIEEAKKINAEVIAAHHKHYEGSPQGLIDTSPNASPNGNLIYHLYSDGTVTFQKGAYAYLQRSEFTDKSKLYPEKPLNDLNYSFVKKAADGTTYAILTEGECLQFRARMASQVEELNTLLR
jgi:hypothetical protein